MTPSSAAPVSKPVPSNRDPEAVLNVSAFTVTSSILSGWFEYEPQLRLAETSGKSGVTVTSFVFELLGAGDPGAWRVPPIALSKRVEAGETRDMISSYYGEAEYSLSSRVNFPGVSVTIFFVDDDGHQGSVSATADITPLSK